MATKRRRVDTSSRKFGSRAMASQPGSARLLIWRRLPLSEIVRKCQAEYPSTIEAKRRLGEGEGRRDLEPAAVRAGAELAVIERDALLDGQRVEPVGGDPRGDPHLDPEDGRAPH